MRETRCRVRGPLLTLLETLLRDEKDDAQGETPRLLLEDELSLA